MSGGGGGESSGEKSFEASQQRIARAREKGDIARSTDVTAAAAYLGLLVVTATAGGAALMHAGSDLMIFLDQPDRLAGQILGSGGPLLSARIIGDILLSLAPFLLAPAVAVLVALFAQQGVVFSGEKLMPQFSRISPLGNAKKRFGTSGIVEFLKSFVKAATICWGLVWYMQDDIDAFIGSSTAEPAAVTRMTLDAFSALLTITVVVAVAIAGLDLVWQRFDHSRRLRMTHQELREEHKESEGDPHMKAQRRGRAEAIAMNRMLLDVPKADVVIVNPTHYAVALKWTRAKGSAPACVAKGADGVALRIRAVAELAGVPIHQDAPTARALHATVEIGQEIAPDHYRAVAAAIRFSDRMRKAARARGLS